jgi:hypothetical protein
METHPERGPSQPNSQSEWPKSGGRSRPPACLVASVWVHFTRGDSSGSEDSHPRESWDEFPSCAVAGGCLGFGKSRVLAPSVAAGEGRTADSPGRTSTRK